MDRQGCSTCFDRISLKTRFCILFVCSDGRWLETRQKYAQWRVAESPPVLQGLQPGLVSVIILLREGLTTLQTIIGTRYQCTTCPSSPNAYSLVCTSQLHNTFLITILSANHASRSHMPSMTQCTLFSRYQDLFMYSSSRHLVSFRNCEL
jgi:hypothetical protein